MTEGKQVQDFIKSQKKTAREMFEEAGWEFEEGRKREIVYWKNKSSIIFYTDYELFKGFISMHPINMETLKLINCQCKELGWL